MQINNNFFKGARNIRLIAGGVIFAIAGLFFAGLGVYFLIKPNANIVLGACIGFIALGSIVAIVGILSVIFGIRRMKKMKPLTKEQIKENEEKYKEENKNAVIIESTKLYFHHCGKLNQSFLAEDIDKNVIYECHLIKFNPLLANTFEFINHKNNQKRIYKMGKVVSQESNNGIITGAYLSSSFKINGESCWDYLRNRGYQIKSFIGNSKTFVSFELHKEGELVAKIVPADVKYPFDENKLNLLRANRGYFRVEINKGNLDDIMMATFIVSLVDFVE